VDEQLTMTINPREFLRIFNEQNIKHILDDSYRLNLIRFENKELHIFGNPAANPECNKKGFFEIIQRHIQDKKIMIDLFMKNGSEPLLSTAVKRDFTPHTATIATFGDHQNFPASMSSSASVGIKIE